MQKFYEKKVKELALKSSNKECFDCLKKGVQGNVNLSHNTFICTRCAGLHRGLNHKVNSIGMVNFTKDIYEALESGGNKRAKKHWLAKLPEDYKRPDQNEAKLLEFLRSVYIEQRFVRKEGDPKKPQTAKKKKATTRDGEPKSATSDSSRSQSQTIPSQKTGDSQVSQTSHSTHSGGSEKEDGESDTEAEDAHKSSSAGGFDMLTDFTISEVDVKTPQNGHSTSKKSEPDIFGESSPIIETPPKSLSKSRTAVDALVEHLREVMKEFYLNPQQIKSITSEALAVLAEEGTKSHTTQPRREGEPEGGNPFDDEFEDEPASTATTPMPLTKPPTVSRPPSSSSTSSASLFPDLDATPTPAVQLGPSTTGFGTSYRPPQTQTYPPYGQSGYAPSPAPSMPTSTMSMSGVLPGMNSGGYHQPSGTYPPTYPPGVSYNMSISMGGFSPYPSAFPQQQQVPEKPKGPDLFAGLDPFGRS